MVIIFKSSSKNVYANSIKYNELNVEENVLYKGVNYSKRIKYEKKLSNIHCLFLRILAFLSKPFCNPKTIKKWHQSAITGVETKTVLVLKGNKQVQFGTVRCREFPKGQVPQEIRNINSVEIKNLKNDESLVKTQERKPPPLGFHDTICIRNNKFSSVHPVDDPDNILFSDTEIIEKLDIVKKVAIEIVENAPNLSEFEMLSTPKSIYANYTKHGKAIIQQQGVRGCTAATAAMLIMDNCTEDNIKVDVNALRTRNIGNDDYQLQDIEKAGFTPEMNQASNLFELRNLIIKNDSAIVTVCGRIGGHVIIVDEISEDLSQIRLRDPYHGWEITVTKDAFLNEWRGGNVIQILK